MNKKGVVLIVSLMIMTVLLILIGVYFSSLLTEKKAADTEEFVLQALGLAEAGANQAQAELRERIRTDLLANVRNIRLAITFQNYVNPPPGNSLGFLSAFALAVGDNPFVVSGGEATLAIAPLNLNTAVQGNYNANIIVTANGNPTKSPQGEIFVFPYNYRIESQGTITRVVPNITKRARLTQGSFSITVRRDTFAKFALLTAHHRMPSGTTVWFTANTNFTGPVHTNERFSFANNPSGHFTEEVTQHENKARFYNDGWPVLLDADYNGTKDVPTFDKGFQRGEDIINLESSISQTELKTQALGGMPDPGNGIYVPNDGTNVTGGIYIRGNQGNHADDPTINMTVGTNGPVYTISRSGSPTTIVTVDYLANGGTGSTTVDGLTYQGIPDGMGEDPDNPDDDEGIIIYANDDIQSFSGTVQKDTAVTVSSERDIIITDHITYERDPRIAGNEGYKNLLGTLSWGGSVRIGTSAPNDINIQSIVMAPHSVHGMFTVDNYNIGAPRGTANLLGGVIAAFYGPFGTFSGTQPLSGYGRNFVYDARMLTGAAPPYFPFMTNFTSFDDGLNNRLIWQDQGN